MSQPIEFVFGKSEGICISPATEIDRLIPRPGDLSLLAPASMDVHGCGHSRTGNPMKDVPLSQSKGGVIFFANNSNRQDFESTLRVMGVPDNLPRVSKYFSVYTCESLNPAEDGYISQVRLVSRFALRYVFQVIREVEYEAFPEQPLSMTETMWLFVRSELERWGGSFYLDKGLGGMFGGDGYNKCEELAFGFMVESDYYHIYRVWSRAWLVTK